MRKKMLISVLSVQQRMTMRKRKREREIDTERDTIDRESERWGRETYDKLLDGWMLLLQIKNK